MSAISTNITPAQQEIIDAWADSVSAIVDIRDDGTVYIEDFPARDTYNFGSIKEALEMMVYDINEWIKSDMEAASLSGNPNIADDWDEHYRKFKGENTMANVERDIFGQSATERELERVEQELVVAQANAAAENLIGTEAYKAAMGDIEKATAQTEDMSYKPTIWLNLHKSYVKTDLVSKTDGRTFNIATIPKGTTINGTDVGGRTFFPLFVSTNKFNPNLASIPLLEGGETWLFNKDKEKIVVSNTDLKVAVDAQNKAYLAAKKAAEKEADQEKTEQPSEEKEEPAQNSKKSLDEKIAAASKTVAEQNKNGHSTQQENERN